MPSPIRRSLLPALCLGLATCALALPATAPAAPTLVAPTAAQSLPPDEKPTFSWSFAPGESQPTVLVSRAATPDAGGVLLADANRVETLVPAATATTAAPTTALFAGTYYWQVVARDAAGAQVVSEIRQFVLPAAGSALSVTHKLSLKRRQLSGLLVFGTNVTKPVVSLRIFLNGKRRFNVGTTLAMQRSLIDSGAQTDWMYRLPKGKAFARGTRVKFVFTVSGGGMRPDTFTKIVKL